MIYYEENTKELVIPAGFQMTYEQGFEDGYLAALKENNIEEEVE